MFSLIFQMLYEVAGKIFLNIDLNGDHVEAVDDVDRICGRYHDMRWM